MKGSHWNGPAPHRFTWTDRLQRWRELHRQLLARNGNVYGGDVETISAVERDRDRSAVAIPKPSIPTIWAPLSARGCFRTATLTSAPPPLERTVPANSRDRPPRTLFPVRGRSSPLETKGWGKSPFHYDAGFAARSVDRRLERDRERTSRQFRRCPAPRCRSDQRGPCFGNRDRARIESRATVRV